MALDIAYNITSYTMFLKNCFIRHLWITTCSSRKALAFTDFLLQRYLIMCVWFINIVYYSLDIISSHIITMYLYKFITF